MPSVYVGTYARYRSGSLFGKWFDLDEYDDKDEFIDACKEFHKAESDPELMFQGWEDIPNKFISEGHIKPEFWDYMSSTAPDEAKEVYMQFADEWDEQAFYGAYIGEFETITHFAEQQVEDSCILVGIPENVAMYFDYDRYADDMILNGEVYEDCGHYFWRF